MNRIIRLLSKNSPHIFRGNFAKRKNHEKPIKTKQQKDSGEILAETCPSGFFFFFVFLFFLVIQPKNCFFMYFAFLGGYPFRSMSRMWAEFGLLRILYYDILLLNFGLWVAFLILLQILHNFTQPFHAYSLLCTIPPPLLDFWILYKKYIKNLMIYNLIINNNNNIYIIRNQKLYIYNLYIFYIKYIYKILFNFIIFYMFYYFLFIYYYYKDKNNYLYIYSIIYKIYSKYKQ